MIALLLTLLVVLSLLMSAQAGYTGYLMLYTWNEASKRDRYRASATFAAPQKSFTVLLPARHEEDVIQRTIQCVLNANYPKDLMEIAVICRIDDPGTIAKVQEKIADLVTRG